MLHESQKREKALIYQLQVVENRYAVATSDLAKAKQEAAKNEEDLTARVVAAESFLLKKEKELRNHRKHATQTAPDHSSTSSTKFDGTVLMPVALAASLDEINKSIEGLALRICTSLDWHDARALLDREALRKLEWRNKPAHALLQHFVACGVSSAATLGEVAKPIARSLFCAVLSDVVFIPFAPGCSSESHEHVAKLYAYVSSRGKWMHGPHAWRAFTDASSRTTGELWALASVDVQLASAARKQRPRPRRFHRQVILPCTARCVHVDSPTVTCSTFPYSLRRLPCRGNANRDAGAPMARCSSHVVLWA